MSSNRWVYHFSDALPTGSPDAKVLLGGKGAGLLEMRQAGLPVPPGFTITTECCAKYYELGRRWPDGLEQEVREHLDRLEVETSRSFGAGVRPLLVSTRSGAAISMPGMMDTLLNCGLHPGLANDVGDSEEFWQLFLSFLDSYARIVHGRDGAIFKESAVLGMPPSRVLAEAQLRVFHEMTGAVFPTDPWSILVSCINAVFESWQSERAVVYRRRHDIHGLAGTAVNIQEMFPSEVSGVVFTQDPTAPEAGRIVIEASYGLGESVVSGEVTPDRFLVDREHFTVTASLGQKHSSVAALGNRRIFDPNAWALSAEELRELAELSLRVEKHFGHPVDLEWGLAKGRYSLLQARRIRGLEAVRDLETARRAEIEHLRKLAGSERCCWVAHNLGETLLAPTPLTWDVVRGFMSGAGGFGRLYEMLGYRPSAHVRREGFLELIGGRIYADPRRMAGLFWDGLPLAYDVSAVIANKSLLDSAPTKFDPDLADGRFLLKLPATLLAMWKSSRLVARKRKTARERFEEEVLPPYLEYVRHERQRDLRKLTEEDLVAELRARRQRVLDEFAPESLLPGFLAGLAFASLQSTLGQLMGPDEGAALARKLTRALEGDTTVEQDAFLHDVAKDNATLAEFLDKYGHRCVGEMELAEPRWREAPEYLLRAVAQMRALDGHDSRSRHIAARRDREEAERRLPDLLAHFAGSSLQEEVMVDLHDAQSLLPYRESGKHYLMMGYELLRLVLEELSLRLNLARGIYYLRFDELTAPGGDRKRWPAVIAERRTQWAAFKRFDLPEVIDSSDLEELGNPRTVVATSELNGTPVAPGVAMGVGGRPSRVYVLYGVSVVRSRLRMLPSYFSPMP